MSKQLVRVVAISSLMLLVINSVHASRWSIGKRLTVGGAIAGVSALAAKVGSYMAKAPAMVVESFPADIIPAIAEAGAVEAAEGIAIALIV